MGGGSIDQLAFFAFREMSCGVQGRAYLKHWFDYAQLRISAAGLACSAMHLRAPRCLHLLAHVTE